MTEEWETSPFRLNAPGRLGLAHDIGFGRGQDAETTEVPCDTGLGEGGAARKYQGTLLGHEGGAGPSPATPQTDPGNTVLSGVCQMQEPRTV